QHGNTTHHPFAREPGCCADNCELASGEIAFSPLRCPGLDQPSMRHHVANLARAKNWHAGPHCAMLFQFDLWPRQLRPQMRSHVDSLRLTCEITKLPRLADGAREMR